MNYVRSISGTVSKTWNSINPATLSGAIDVIVVEQEDGSLACSPFHVRFGKFSLLRPSDKKVEFTVNGEKQNYAMKLGDGGEAFFVFETSDDIPESMQTSPLVSPASSPPMPAIGAANAGEPDFLDLDQQGKTPKRPGISVLAGPNAGGALQEPSSMDLLSSSDPRPQSGDWSGYKLPQDDKKLEQIRSRSDEAAHPLGRRSVTPTSAPRMATDGAVDHYRRSASPPPLPQKEAVERAISLSKQLADSNIPSHVTDTGDLMLDMTGYKTSDDEALRAEIIARKILSEELEGPYDIGALIGADEHGNLWIYSSEEAKEAAAQRAQLSGVGVAPGTLHSDAASDPGYHSDLGEGPGSRRRADSDNFPGFQTPPSSPPSTSDGKIEQSRNYAKTLRLTSAQLKSLELKPGPNVMSFTVNRATCTAYMYLWSYKTPIVISDIDGTITKSDALGHVLNMIGRDWTHIGVAKLYTEIVANGYNIMYLTSRAVGQADTTRGYLAGVVQEGWRLPRGPTIMSPDRTIAALRREVYLRKPEVFKMACLRDIKNLYPAGHSPFYAGFGNRLTDALSYRSVSIPSNRIFTINSYAEVSLDLLSLNKLKLSYVNMREVVDHYFPPVSTLLQQGGEEFTDFQYWRDTPMELDSFSASESDEDERREERGSEHGDEGSEVGEMGESYMSRESVDGSLRSSQYGGELEEGEYEIGEDGEIYEYEGSLHSHASQYEDEDADYSNNDLEQEGLDEPTPLVERRPEDVEEKLGGDLHRVVSRDEYSKDVDAEIISGMKGMVILDDARPSSRAASRAGSRAASGAGSRAGSQSRSRVGSRSRSRNASAGENPSASASASGRASVEIAKGRGYGEY